jgi:hypothetical protein
LVHVTPVPVFTVRAGGSNAKFLMVTADPPGEAVCVFAGDGDGEDVQPPVTPARIIMTVHAVQNTRREYPDILLPLRRGVKKGRACLQILKTGFRAITVA